jgi:hypothetical protein
MTFAQDMPSQGSMALFGYYTGGAGLGVRYWLSPNMVLAPAVNFGINNNTTKGQGGASDATNNTTTIGIGVGVEMHTVVASVSPYFLGGLSFTTISQTIKPSLAAGTPANGTTLETSITSSPFSVYGGLGFEAFIAKGVSAGLEGQVGVSFGGGKTTVKTQGFADFTGETSTFGLNLYTTSVWLSIYF